MCWKHGGGRRSCEVARCSSMALGKTVLCGKHGGGRRCEVAGCGSIARGKTVLCGKHGGGLRCEVAGSDKIAQGKPGMCSGCKTKAKAKQQVSEEASKPRVTDEVKQHAVDEAAGKLTGDAARRGLRPTGHIT